MDSYYIIFSIITAYAVYGIYIYLYKRDNFDMKEVMNLFLLTLIFRAFDYASTIYFTNKIGIEHEGNLIARTLMFMFGNYLGLLVSLAFFIPLTFFLFVGVNYNSQNKFSWKLFKIIVILTGIIVPIINVLGAINI